jgi:putative nucleotidyltransferase with HDIG domain
MMQNLIIETRDHLQVQAYAWLPQGKPVAVMQIAHGMQEHARRYDHFARWMNAHQVAVFANDHIGHGLTAGSKEELSHFPGKDDWQRSADIMHQLSAKIRADYTGIPLILLGHSMGSVLVQTSMIRYGKDAEAYILSGAIRQSNLMAGIGMVLTNILTILFGNHHRSRLIIFLGYGQYNKHFRPNRTQSDWLSRDKSIVDDYIHSPFCGIPLTNGFYRNFIHGFSFIASRRNLKKIPAGKHVLIIAGKSDPAGFFGKGPLKISKLLTKFAKADVTLNLYPHCRHEILNELNREDVYRDVREWIVENLKLETGNDMNARILEIINKYYPEGTMARSIYLPHCLAVTDLALKISRAHPELNADEEVLKYGGMLHDIGIIFTNAPEIGCNGNLPYLAHGYIGRELLEKEGLPLIAPICERHIGVGITIEDINTRNLSLPLRDMTPQTIEEKIICYADKFYSKSARNILQPKPLEKVKKSIIKHGEGKWKIFEEMMKIFGTELIDYGKLNGDSEN